MMNAWCVAAAALGAAVGLCLSLLLAANGVSTHVIHRAVAIPTATSTLAVPLEGLRWTPHHGSTILASHATEGGSTSGPAPSHPSVPLGALCGVGTAAAAVVAAFASTGRRTLGRREALAVAVAVVAAAGPAVAASKTVNIEKEYKEDTLAVLSAIRAVLTLDAKRGDPALVAAADACKPLFTDWIAKYRRDDRFEGRGSFGAAYTAINALAGHWGDVGRDVPLPTKRASRVLQNVTTAEGLILKGR